MKSETGDSRRSMITKRPNVRNLLIVYHLNKLPPVGMAAERQKAARSFAEIYTAGLGLTAVVA